jgi:hypothetical protein
MTLRQITFRRKKPARERVSGQGHHIIAQVLADGGITGQCRRSSGMRSF